MNWQRNLIQWTPAFAPRQAGSRDPAVAFLRKHETLPTADDATPARPRIDPARNPSRKTPGFDALLQNVSLQTSPGQ
jgi:hypothetical protein